MSDRDEILSELEDAIGYLDDAKKEVHELVVELFPVGARVEVEIRTNQKCWSPATVTGHRAHSPDHVTVQLDNAKPRSRQRFRSIPFRYVRLVDAGRPA
ncbi:hypothetical protein GIY62_06305 [Burkholderia plantarii]|uniref:hypothetical protein n=1 Tax=Burkholderia plantarii TaxID=41899 RepID=UPI00272CE71D|nr:hypothetical protein [Burkholderia plantarii]WLE60270.1 hypothetical protein GIY62_06305 [Burkholderia plantarii]